MFSNRDYVFNRRYLIDKEKNIIVIINRSTEHPIIPEKPKIHRVKIYWSCMVIKADTDVDEVSDCIVSETLVLKFEVSEKENGFNVYVLHKCHASVMHPFNMCEYYHSFIQIQDWCRLAFSWYLIEIFECIHVIHSRWMTAWYIRVGCDHLLPDPFVFIIYGHDSRMFCNIYSCESTTSSWKDQELMRSIMIHNFHSKE